MGCSSSTPARKECINVTAMRDNLEVEKRTSKTSGSTSYTMPTSAVHSCSTNQPNQQLPNNVSISQVCPTITNDVSADMILPEPQYPFAPVGFPCLRGYAKAIWPIRCFAKIALPVNASHGGCAGLVLCSNNYGGKGEETTAELLLFRAGFKGNCYEVTRIKAVNEGHFGCQNNFETDQNGELLGNLMFGVNRVCVMTSHPGFGDLTHGVRVDAGDAGVTELPLDVNGADGSGNTLVICRGSQANHGEPANYAALYMVRSGFKDSNAQAYILSGDDKWMFGVEGNMLTVTGPNRSVYALYHNRTECINPNGDEVRSPLAGHSQVLSGDTETLLFTSREAYGVAVVICSNSSGTAETATCAAVYLISIAPGDKVKTVLLSGSVGADYVHSTPDLWAFNDSDGKVTATGPGGPCRYGFISNMAGESAPKRMCLATGEKQPVVGAVDINTACIIGWVSKPSDVKIVVDEAVELVIQERDLREVSLGRFAFAHNWPKDDPQPGLHIIAAVAQRMHVTDGTVHDVPLSGSPRRLVWQAPGVIYALNCGGPAFEASDGIIYTNELADFGSYTYDVNKGSRYTCLGTIKRNALTPQLVAGTPDGPMYVSDRTPYSEPNSEKYVNYKVPNIPNGKYTLRINTVRNTVADMKVNDKSAQHEVDPQLKARSEIVPGSTARSAEVGVIVTANTLSLTGKQYCLCSFALLDKTFTCREKSKEVLKQQEADKKQLAESLIPLTRSMTQKERKLVGWSTNLLLNSSAEAGGMSGWNHGGDWAIHNGGHGTEKAFITSHMWCTKNQVVSLPEHFSEDYLDTAPRIQVSEAYREGVGGGGHYYFKATLMDGHGKTIAEHLLPKTETIYRNNAWTVEQFTFTDYGPGVREVYLESGGKDDKYWGGHYGPIMSAAIVRVQRPTVVPEGDVFEDVKHGDSQDEKEQVKSRDQIVSQILAEHEAMVDSLVDDQSVPATAGTWHPKGFSHMERPKARRKREVRVFVSSTFRDFTQEREELIKKTFREVNTECASRGVFFTYVDLRWGITENQTNHGQTIAICLQEIDRCRPYFVCLMGERYGWARRQDVPDNLLDDSFTYAIQNFPGRFDWIQNYRIGTSVTMLEVLHGALNDAAATRDRSFFYLREAISPADVPADRYQRVRPETDWHATQQAALRRLVEEKGIFKVRHYRQPDDACAQIKKDLLWAIDEDFPLGTEPTPLEREREAHMAFAEARRRVYIGREEYFTQISAFLSRRETAPLVIVGESGSGKSALVANWVGRLENAHRDAFIFVHFIGSSAESASYLKMLRRLYEEMKLFYRFDQAVPTSDQELVRDLPVWLRMAGSTQDAPCIIVLDAINQLDSGAGPQGAEHDLLWVPRPLPSGVGVVMSSLPGRAMDAATKAGWSQLRVEPLQEAEKRQVVSEYLQGVYGKTLSEEQRQLIVSAPQTDTPIYLKALLDEVRMFGNFRKLTNKIQDYLIAKDPPELFARILSRFEEDFEVGQHQRPGLVRQMTAAIWCSHKGMSEAELLDLLQIPSPVWSPFYLSVVDNLVNRNGILNFFHDHLRKAVEAKYVPSDEEKRQGYIEVADYFARRPVDARAAEELPFLLASAGQLERLKAIISDLGMFRQLIKTEEGKFDLIKSWTLLGPFTQVAEVYSAELTKVKEGDLDSDQFAQLKQALAEFFVDLGLFAAARVMLESLLQQMKKKYRMSYSTIVYDAYSNKHSYLCNHPTVIGLLHKLGSVCEKQKEFDMSLDYFHQAMYLQTRIDSPQAKIQLTEGLLGQATALYLRSDMQRAKQYMLRAQELVTGVLGPRHHYVAGIYNKLGQLSYKQGRLDEALGCFLRDLQLTRADVGLRHPRVAGVLNDVALVYDDRGDPRAGQSYESALQLLLARYGHRHLDVAIVRYNLGAFYFATFSFARAKFQLTEALLVFEQFLGTDHKDTVECRSALDDVAAFM